MPRRSWSIYGIVSLFVIVLIFGVYLLGNSGVFLPPLLRGADVGIGNVWGVRPSPMLAQLYEPTPAFSLEINKKLLLSYPKGTRALQLERDLVSQGFRVLPPCSLDSTIKDAKFHANSWIFPATAEAEVFWKVDGNGDIEWAVGFFAYSSF